MNPGIILRNNLKTHFETSLPQEGELVFAIDTDEIGSLSNGELVWEVWDFNETQFAFRGDTPPDNSLGIDGARYLEATNEIKEFIKENGGWRELHFGVDEVWVHENLEPNFHNVADFPYLGKYSYSMIDGYQCIDEYDIVTKEYLESKESPVENSMKLDGSSEFIVGYDPINDDDDVVTLGHLLSGNAQFVVPDTEPDVGGALWNDNGELKISQP